MTASSGRYRECSWLRWRTFELTQDSLVVRVMALPRSLLPVESRWPLGELEAEVAGRSRRYRTDQHAVFVGLVVAGCFVAAILLLASGPPSVPYWLLWFSSACIALLAAGFFTGLDQRQVDYVHFKHRSGTIVLDIGRLGPDADQFDEFVEAIRDRIIQGRLGTDIAARQGASNGARAGQQPHAPDGAFG